MAQHDMNIADALFPAFRADLNLALLALASQNAGAAAPSSTYAYMHWLDTSGAPINLIKIRNAADDAWIPAWRVDDSDDTVSIDAVNVDILDSGAFYSGSTVEAALAEAAALTWGQHTIWIPAAAMVPTSTNGATAASQELTTNDVMISALDYDSSTVEHAQCSFQAPKSSDETAGFVAQIVWKDGATAGSGNVVWGIKALAVGDDDALDAAFGAAQTVTDTRISTANDCMISPESGVITPAGTWAAEDMLFFDVYRDAAAGGDTYTQDARLLGLRLHITTAANTDD